MSCAGAGDAGSLGGRPSGTDLHHLHANYRFMSLFPDTLPIPPGQKQGPAY